MHIWDVHLTGDVINKNNTPQVKVRYFYNNGNCDRRCSCSTSAGWGTINGFHIALSILSKQIPLKSRATTIRVYMAWGVSNEHVTVDRSGSVFNGWTSAELIQQVFDPINHYPRR